jgi:hypothetical protein
MKQLKRFWDKVRVSDEPDSCWNWKGCKDRDGYGKVRINKLYFRSHRLSYLIHNGDLPEQLEVMHSCDNPSCVNPSHLSVGTPKDNATDRINRGRTSKGENHPMHKLTQSQVDEIRLRYKWHSRDNNIVCLSKEYGVSFSVIAKIVKHQSWR